MIKRRSFPRIYFGWWINLVTSILSGLSSGFYTGVTVLFKPIAAELGLSRAAASVATGTGALCDGLIFAISGWLSDKFGPKWVIIAGTCIMGIGLVLMDFINSAWTYYLVWGVIITAGHALCAMVAVDKMLNDWFISKRGLALGIRFALMGIMGVIVLPLMSWLSVTQGWRMTCLIWAGVMFAGVPLLFYFVRQRRPEYYGLLPDGATVESGPAAGVDGMIAKGVEYAAGFQETEFTLREAMRTPSYWMLTVVWILHRIIMRGFSVHCVPFLTDMGIDPIVAGSMMAMMIFFTIPSRFLGGFLADRVGRDRLKFLMAAPLILMAAGITVFLLNQTITTVYIFLILYGFGNGAFIPLDIVVRGRYFGRKAYGSIQGASAIMAAPVVFFAPVYVGWVYDVSGSYTTAFTVLAAIAVSAVFILFLLRAPKPPAQVGDIRRFM